MATVNKRVTGTAGYTTLDINRNISTSGTLTRFYITDQDLRPRMQRYNSDGTYKDGQSLAYTSEVTEITNSLSDGQFYAKKSNICGMRDRNVNIDGTGNRTEFIGYTNEGYPIFNIVGYGADGSSLLNFLRMWFDGSNIYAQGIKNGGDVKAFRLDNPTPSIAAISVTSGLTLIAGFVKKCGAVYNMTFYASGSKTITDNGTHVVNLPEGYRPDTTIIQNCGIHIADYGYYTARAAVGTDGKLYLYANSKTADYIWGSFTWII